MHGEATSTISINMANHNHAVAFYSDYGFKAKHNKLLCSMCIIRMVPANIVTITLQAQACCYCCLCLAENHKTDAQKSICNKFLVKWQSLTRVRCNLLTKLTVYMHIKQAINVFYILNRHKHKYKLTSNKPALTFHKFLCCILHVIRCTVAILLVCFHFFWHIKTRPLSSWHESERESKRIAQYLLWK